jgi:hypothetical protein
MQAISFEQEISNQLGQILNKLDLIEKRLEKLELGKTSGFDSLLEYYENKE